MRVRIGEAEIEVTGPAAYVEEKVQEFVLERAAAVTRPPETTSSQASEDGTPKGKALSPGEVFKKLSPQTDVDRVLVGAYYLEKVRSQESFTVAEVSAVLKEAKRRPPTNPSDALAKNIKKGLVMAAGDKEGKRAYVLTTDGEEYAERMVEE